MLRILAVDDEPIHLMNLIGVIQVLKPTYIIFSAKDGLQALNILRIFSVDLLITDIKMPKMDGLTLIRKAKYLYPNLNVLILTGYGEFEFAKQAIELGVDDYLLKTLDQEELLKTFAHIETKVRNHQDHSRAIQEQQRMLKKLQEDQLEREIEMYVFGYNRGEQEKLAWEIIRQYKTGLVICSKNLDGTLLEADLSKWRAEISTFLHQWGESYTFRCCHRGGNAASLFHCREKLPLDLLAKLEQFCTGKGLVIGVSTYFDQLAQNIDLAFQQAMEACEYVFFSPGRFVFQYQQSSAMQPFLLRHINLQNSEAREYLLEGNVAKSADVIISNSKAYIEKYKPYPNKFKEVLMFSFCDICSEMKNLISDDHIRQMMLVVDQLVMSSKTMSDIEEAIWIMCHQLCDILVSMRKSITKQTMEMAADLLKDNYNYDWTLEKLAKHFHFNSSYFSGLFKQHFGIGYNEYLNEIRLDQAKCLLLQSETRVSDLAQRVGYQSPNYFIRIFRKKYGLTPSEYRRTILVEQK